MIATVLAAIAYYLGGCVIGALIFAGIGSHICSKDREFYEFVADVNAAHERGEL